MASGVKELGNMNVKYLKIPEMVAQNTLAGRVFETPVLDALLPITWLQFRELMDGIKI